MANNIYSEMFESIKIPDRLSPENIAAMLDANAAEQRLRSGISVKTSDNISKSADTSDKTNSKKSGSAYRAVASVAACAVMVFGLVRYFDVGEVQSAGNDIKGSTYASDYDELHKTFRKYYVDDEGKMTLDSAMAEIDHSYNDGRNDAENDNVDKTPEEEKPPVTTGDNPVIEDIPDGPDDIPEEEQPDDPFEEEPEKDYGIRLPEPSVPEDDGVLVADGRIYVRDGSSVKVILTSGGRPDYIGDAVPEYGLFETKTLEEIYAVDSRLIAVYSVITEEPLSVPAFEDGETVIGDTINSVYPEFTQTQKIHSTEIAVYDINGDGRIERAATVSQSGKLVDSKIKDGYVYVVTSYDDYRRSPLIGVDDLESYVPSYTVNGEKFYIQPENILIPEYVSTTDYTVVSGIAAALPSVPVSVQAVLGSEGKVIVTDSAVYVFGFSDSLGTCKTTVEKLSLNYGSAMFEGASFAEGVAVNGGIKETDNAILVTTLRETNAGYITSVNALDSSMNVMSKIDFPSALTNVSFDGAKVFLNNGTDFYAADFSSPAAPALIEYGDDIDVTSGLVPFQDGYITLTKDDEGRTVLAKISSDQSGEFAVEAEITVTEEQADSMALKNNYLMYCDSGNGYVGVPYGYYDGFDYCYRFVMYKYSAGEFSEIGRIESHEVEDAFEFKNAILHDGILYVFSDGRIYSAAVGENALSVIGSADLIESSYSGHTNR